MSTQSCIWALICSLDHHGILLEALNAYNPLDEFLENVALEAKKDDTDKADSVHILSIHKAKGLEWDKVFLPFFNQGILPLGEYLEEERRLCYMAITRPGKSWICLPLIVPLGWSVLTGA